MHVQSKKTTIMSGKNLLAIIGLAAFAGLAGFLAFEQTAPTLDENRRRKVSLPEYPAQEMQSMEGGGSTMSSDGVERDENGEEVVYMDNIENDENFVAPTADLDAVSSASEPLRMSMDARNSLENNDNEVLFDYTENSDGMSDSSTSLRRRGRSSNSV